MAMGPITTQTKRHLIIRLANVIYANINLGLVSDIKMTMKPIVQGRDSFGRTVTSLYDLKVEFNILSSDNTSLQQLFEIMRDYGTNTLKIFGYGGDVEITEVILQLELEMDFAGQPSKIKASFDRYISETEAITIWKATETIGLPPIENIIDGNPPPDGPYGGFPV